MLDINKFRIDKMGDPEIIRQSQIARGADIKIVDEIIALDREYISLLYKNEQLNKQINVLQKNIGKRIKNSETYDELLAEKNQLSSKINLDQQNILLAEIQKKLSLVGNIIHATVPISGDETDNKVVRKYGTPSLSNAEFKILGYPEIMARLDIVDTERAAKIAGHRAYFLKNQGVLLNQALINYGLKFLVERGYDLLQPPFYMNRDVIRETVQLSDYDENLYKISTSSIALVQGANDEKYLIATSEQPISAYHRQEIIPEEKLPIKYAGYSSCFRKEAGAHGRDVQGIFRVHQFEKVEQFCITRPEDSWEMFEKMISISEEFYQKLGLHYQIVNIVSGALNNAAAKKYDLEAWFPESKRYRELVSCSNCTDYQSASMDIRLRRSNNKSRDYVHCLNSTLCATERTLCCLVENYQTENGIMIPEVLQPFMGCDFIAYKK